MQQRLCYSVPLYLGLFVGPRFSIYAHLTCEWPPPLHEIIHSAVTLVAFPIRIRALVYNRSRLPHLVVGHGHEFSTETLRLFASGGIPSNPSGSCVFPAPNQAILLQDMCPVQIKWTSLCALGSTPYFSLDLLTLMNFASDQGPHPKLVHGWDEQIFELYKNDIEHQIRMNKPPFYSLFINALKSYPDLSYHDFHIRISIGIDHKGINVTDVSLNKRLDDSIRITDGVEKPEGDIVLAFTAYHLDVIVCLDVPMSIRLEELPEKRWWRRLWWRLWRRYKNGAYDIADRLSDKRPENTFTWRISSVIDDKIRRRRESRINDY